MTDPFVSIVDKDGNEKRADELKSQPSTRDFREAWVLSGDVISEDLNAAKELFKDKIREVRKPLLEAEDTVYMKAMEANDESAKQNSAAKKTKLRDAPEASAISSADSIDALKAAWDADLLGTSPYS
jgi:hypothetical protein